MDNNASLAFGLFLLLLLGVSLPTDACRSIPVDRTPPRASYCPSPIYTKADARYTSTVVRWSKPTAYDPSPPVTVRRVNGPRNGGRFYGDRGSYKIWYTATDGKGNKNYCLCPSFRVSVTVTRCYAHPHVTNGGISCSHSNVYGSVCYFSCSNGYSLRGSSYRTCQWNARWSGSTPTCTPIQCAYLSGADCSNGNYYNSRCKNTCGQGYSLAPGQSEYTVCQSNGRWTGSPWTCLDTSSPTLTCPDNIKVYAEPSQTNATVEWDTPTVRDNSMNTGPLNQTHGLPSNSTFERGYHRIEYAATDAAGNTGTCSFSVIVQVIQCTARTLQPCQMMTCSANFIYGSVCEFNCSDGLVLIGESSNECMGQADSADGVWSADQPTCQGIVCPSLNPPTNGHFGGGGLPCPTDYGSLCTFECNDGYDLTGSAVRHCQATAGQAEGFWDGFEAHCEVQTCPRAYISNHAFITNLTECPITDRVPAESTCHFACRPGYVLTGSAEVTCGLDGEWNSSFPRCEAITCDSKELPAPLNGIKNGCPHPEENCGTTCTLSCNLGYMPTQPSLVTCTDDGNGVGYWDGNTLTCEEIKCDPLTLPESPGYMDLTCTLNGIDVIQTDQMQSYATVCKASCDLGFTASGSGSRTCQLTGEWDGTPLLCYDITPPTLRCPSDITLFAGQGTNFAVVSYDWEPIQALDASGNIIATLSSINGQPVPANRSSIFHEGTYRLVYSAQDSSDNSATCEVMVEVVVTRCPALHGPEYSEIALVSGKGDCANSVVYGSVCSISCQDGYTLSNSTDVVNAECTKTTSTSTIGSWQSPSVDCIANTCQVPAIPNGYVSGCLGSEVDFGSSCSFVCHPGYRSNLTAMSHTMRACRADGTWTGQDFYCEAVECPGFLSLSQGSVQPNECSTAARLPYNTQCSFECNDGYSLNGPYSKVCSAEGVWSDTHPVSCIDHQPPVFNDSCPVYYSQIAPPNMRQAMVTFPTPEATDNSNDVTVTSTNQNLVSGSSFIEGTTRVTYKATDATMNTRNCDVYVTVQVLRCRPLQAPASGSLVSCPSSIYGATCYFTCNPGYTLHGNSSRTCEKVYSGFIVDQDSDNNVDWSGETPTCQRITCPALPARPPALRSSCLNYPPATEQLGTTCNWHCPYGYSGVGSPQSVCMANGTWDVIDFTCVERSCPALVAMTGMEIAPANCLTSPTFNDNCFLRCSLSGYRVDPPSYDFIRCLGNGDWSQDSSVFTCVDYESPHFTSCPLDLTVYTSGQSTEANVTWNVVAADNSGEDPTIQCNLHQPATLSVGDHSVSCSAEDATGNGATCNFNVQVKVRRCLPLHLPFYGDFLQPCDTRHGSTCQVICQPGYKLQGNDTATCSRNTSTGMMYWSWSGPRPTCQVARCPPLPSDVPAGGGVYPALCLGPVQPFYGTQCHFFCRNEFELQGPVEHRILTCQPDGSWDQNLNTLDVRCQDLEPPTLRVCPGSLSGTMSGQTLGVSLSFDEPMAMDNSEAPLTLVKTPADITSPYNFTRDTSVSYVFSDSAGNSVECTFDVNIQDNLSPVIVSCPDDQDVTTQQQEEIITWPEPEFVELTGDELNVACSRENGSSFSWGRTVVQCHATNLDNNKTTMCQFTITVSPTDCVEPSPPENGAKACDLWFYGRFCYMSCRENYDIRNKDSESSFLTCGSSGHWLPSSDFPGCTRLLRPHQMKLLSEWHYFSGDCTSNATQLQIKEQFILRLSQSKRFSSICTQNPDECYADNVAVTCDPVQDGRLRRSVDIWEESPLDYGLDQLNATHNGVTAEEFTEQAQKLIAELRKKGKLPFNRRDERRRLPSSERSFPKWGRLHYRTRRSTDKPNELTISFRVNRQTPLNSETMTDEEFADWAWMDDVVEAIYNMRDDAGMHQSFPGLDMDESPRIFFDEPEPTCQMGYIPLNRLGFCGGCSAGQYFYNDTRSCLTCPVGQYQDEEAQFACKMCPSGMTTFNNGSKNFTDCLVICPSGHFSGTGLKPCSLCERGTYQSYEGSTYCESCPNGQSTSGVGSTDSSACADICPAGEYSTSGVEPCTPCPLHSYQPEQGQSSCHPCPAGHVIQHTGAAHADMCIALTSCNDTICWNGGTCVRQMAGTYVCTCPVGVTGRNCEIEVNDCLPDSCFNGATCTDHRNGFNCSCSPGYEGDDCSIATDYCQDDPCDHGGMCTSQSGTFTCTCDLGFTGMTCSDDIDECQTLDPVCQNGATCVNGEGDYRCDCAAGFTGDHCEIDVDVCKSNPCQHSGACVEDVINGYRCLCLPGFSGSNCEIDEDLCANNPCEDGSTCQDLDTAYQCACPNGRGGVHCEIALQPCDYHPCMNDGTCTDTPAEDMGYKCDCRQGFMGPDCKININECSSDPCSNGGTCIDGINSFQCHCAEGFQGPRCGARSDLCDPNPCHSNAPCEDEGDDYYCTCPMGRSGRDCEIQVDVCIEGQTCLNGGTCALPSMGQLCQCVDGFVGERCEIDFDDCHSQPCANDGICIDGINSFTCSCMDGFTGALCNDQINECLSSPCQNGGTCVNKIHGFYCHCDEGFNGIQCEINKDDCFPGACVHGQCMDEINAYKCQCQAGYSGRQCDVDVNECQSYPCANGATCHDMVNSFICDCKDGWVGKQCDMFEDMCWSQPCLNAGRCINGNQSYTCQCPAGFTGPVCEVNINECLDDPCQRGSTCIDGINSYTCQCRSGMKGKKCQISTSHCQPNPCKHGGICLTSESDFQCLCQDGFQGVLCEVNIDDCVGHFCQNEATCVDHANRYSCRCAPGFGGQFCERHLDLCLAEPCENNGLCNSTGNRNHHCTCQPGFTGVRCEVPIDYCKPNPCLRGSCINGRNAWSCVCSPGYTGEICDVDIDECLSHPCQNEAQCINGINQYQCKCRPGFTGTHCEDHTLSDFDMEFRGTLANQSVTLSYAVDRPLPAFTLTFWIRTNTTDAGLMSYIAQPHSQMPRDVYFAVAQPEALVVFLQGSPYPTAINVSDSHWHHVAISWNESQQLYVIYKDGHLRWVQSNIRRGTTISAGGAFIVGTPLSAAHSQSSGFTGSISNVNLWDTVLEEAVIGQHAETCGYVDPGNVFAAADFMDKASIGDVRVQAPSLCDVVDDCASDPCQNGATCIDDVGHYTCNCPHGFTGQNCNTNIDDCGTGASPCDNGGTCMDGIGSFTCLCPPGFSGLACELTKVDGGWRDWSDWSVCNQSCEGGIKVRERFCTNPQPANGGSSCEGPNRQTLPCNTGPCPTCATVQPPTKGDLDCEMDGEERNCSISCWPGHTFSQAVLPFYHCGPSSNYEWSHQTSDNQVPVFPKCLKYRPPIKFGVEMDLAYTNHLACDGVNVTRDQLVHQGINNVLTSNLQNVDCVKNNKCNIKQVQVSGCSPTSFRDRSGRSGGGSTEPVRVNMKLESDVHIHQDQQNLTNEQVTDQAESVEVATELRNSAMSMINKSADGHFAISVDNEFYDIDSEKTASYGMQICPPGTVRVATDDARCVPCEAGWYADEDVCRPCPLGMYQTNEGSTYCQACTRGMTTLDTGMMDENACSVIIML